MEPNHLKIVSVNHSTEKGERKKPVTKLYVSRKGGVKNDGESKYWNYEISLLGVEAYQNTSEPYGFWGENLTTEGLDLSTLKPMDCLVSDDARLKVTITAKNVKSDKMVAFNQGGTKDIPMGGIFARAQKEAELTAGMILKYKPKIIKIKVLTLSDRASEGIYEDKSGEIILQMLSDFMEKSQRLYTTDKIIIPDEKEPLEQHFEQAVSDKVDILITTGGTGIGKRDITPDVVKPLLDKEITGIMELIRVKYGMQKPNVLISRSIAGVKDKTLVYCLPGSSKGVQEYLTEIIPTLMHSLYMLHDIQLHG